ncbi:MAG: AAA-like domain-containing protein [Stigonema ocellatum SAG 48.90 = DSM 106950]|nr:AAA-like domain-containing protein [Stigonema ocellatum SAG 48.90 = DSM 106950]
MEQRSLRGQRSVRVRRDCLTRVQSKLLQNGFFSQRDFVERLSAQGQYISQATISNFLNGKAVDRTKFIMICEALGLKWLDIREFPPGQNNPAPSTDNPTEFSPLTKVFASPSQEQVLNITDSQKLPLTEILLEYPEGSVALDSPFYIERPPKEKQCYEEISKPSKKYNQALHKFQEIKRLLPQHFKYLMGHSLVRNSVRSRS